MSAVPSRPAPPSGGPATESEGPSAAFKVIVVGDSGVGKSSLVYRLVDGRFFDEHIPTIGVDFKYTKLEVAGVTVSLQLWDTAGQDQYADLTGQFYRGAHGVLLCFDLTNRSSFERLQMWQDRVQDRLLAPPSPTTPQPGGSSSPSLVSSTATAVPTLLVGCKLDLAEPATADGSPGPSLRDVGTEEVSRWATARGGIPFMETSARSGSNVSTAFRMMVKQMLNYHGIIGRERSVSRPGGAGGHPNPPQRTLALASQPARSGTAGDGGNGRKRKRCCGG